MIYGLYFSPTSGTLKVVEEIIKDKEHKIINVTTPTPREEVYTFTEEDILVIGFPVYAGRLPNLLLNFIQNNIKGNGTKAIAVVTFGNRAYDDALVELCEILKASNFKVVSAAAFSAEHSFSKTLGANRPDENDLKIAKDFSKKSFEKLQNPNFIEVIVPKEREIVYYKPQTDEGKPINILKVAPKTLDSCIKCGLCVKNCPLGSINDNIEVIGKCIKCCACIKNCPVQAKYFDDEGYLYHKEQLERKFMKAVEPTLFY